MSALTLLARKTTKQLTKTRHARTFVSKTKPSRGGDDHHHEHMTFETSETEKFSKFSSGLVCFGGLVFGVGVIVNAAHFQNKKHGFKNGI